MNSVNPISKPGSGAFQQPGQRHATIQQPNWPLRPQTTKTSPPTPSSIDFSNFVFHYSVLGNGSVQDTLSQIANDLESHNDLHDWDENLCPDPVKALASSAKDNLLRIQVDKADYMINFSLVQEAKTISGTNVRRYIPRNTSEASSQLFPATLDMDGVTLRSCMRTKGPRASHGRIVEVKEHINDLQRYTLLLLHPFCLRLLDEEFTFIRAFIQRHLLLETVYTEPSLFQVTTPSDREGSQKCYKRVTMSFHLPHLLLDSCSYPTPASTVVDRQFIDYFGPGPRHTLIEGQPQQCLYKAASSVLLTISSHQEQTSREEEHRFLENPEGLWTVILVNGSWRMATRSNWEPQEYLTPLAQFVRGICSAVIAQKANIFPIIHELKERLRASEDESLFDNRQFSKSRLYHWIIKTCHSICTSIQSNLKFLRDFRINRLPQLRNNAHSYEQCGLEHWSLRLRDEISELDKVQIEVNALREQVVELRDALNGATALLESRIAVMQGERVKTLTYLSIGYIPLSTVSSIYSMSILPKGANLASYFVVLSIIMVFTLFAAIILQTNSSTQAEIDVSPPKKESPKEHLHSIFNALVRMWYLRDAIWAWFLQTNDHIKIFIRNVYRATNYRTSNKFLWPILFLLLLLHKLFIPLGSKSLQVMIRLLWKLPLDELDYTASLLYRPRATVIFQPQFSKRKFVLDVLRFLFLPLWLGLGVIIVEVGLRRLAGGLEGRFSGVDIVGGRLNCLVGVLKFIELF
ncbi:hypothetical protein G7Y89_g9480 [Cudoniella acicularis]|uniref:Uncharacterized protein n=1 Tax=Cudoniella acicularis TaxID=354080 RepID=A0A8H4W2K1_9HELO|nr:hypothetical protein G7Y89_g9480 [Cudoniella acicularis]